MPHCWRQCHNILQWIQCLVMKITCFLFFLFFIDPKSDITWIFTYDFLKLLLLQCNSNKVVKKLVLRTGRHFCPFLKSTLNSLYRLAYQAKIYDRQWRKEIKMQIFGKVGIKSDERQHWDLINFKPPPQTGSDCPFMIMWHRPSEAFECLKCPLVCCIIQPHSNAVTNTKTLPATLVKPCRNKKLFRSY